MGRFTFALLPMLLLTPALAQKEPLRLENRSVAASFDGQGMTSIAGKGVLSAKRELRDAWSLTVDGDTLASRDAKPTVQASAGQVRYLYRVRGYEIAVVYRLEPAWAFVTKELTVLHTPRPRYTIHAVQPLAVELGETVEDARVPGANAPQLAMTPAVTRDKLPARDFGIFLRFGAEPQEGLMLLVQNPFLQAQHTARAASLSYAPELPWEEAWGPFHSDPAVIGADHLTGSAQPKEMLLEWRLPAAAQPTDGLDGGEIDAFTECVRQFLIAPAKQPARVEVGWTLNDYQVDVGTEGGQAEYHRIIDATAKLGIHTLLYAPANTTLAQRDDDTDAWHWEHTLWLNLGQKIRKGEWDPASSPVPDAVQQMIAYAKGKGVGLLAYVYPSVPFTQDKAWLVRGAGAYDPKLGYASLASRAYQDLLLRDLIAFKRRTGIAGYSFDYAFLNLPGASPYAQWRGWVRVMEELKRAEPEIVIDGRQSYQLYGPWSWLAGSYPHPTGQDEQPESFQPYPDLHFDRVSADRTRYVNYWYRNFQFAPSEIVPGYATHQTERSRNVPGDALPHTSEEVHGPYRLRDWDELGFRYSFLSSIATGGWNNVVDMIPARDAEEAKYFPEVDQAWIRSWLDWTDAHKDLLRHTRTVLHAPAMGRVDGTAAVDGDHGFLFLFNPNYRALGDTVRLDGSVGLTQGQSFLLREVYPRAGRLWGKPGAGLWHRGDTVPVALAGTSATVLEVVPAEQVPTAMVFNAGDARFTLDGGMLRLSGVEGEPGTTAELGALLPGGAAVRAVTVNGKLMPFHQTGAYIAVPARFAGERFAQAQQIALKPGADGSLTGTFTVPRRVQDQLRARAQARPIPWTEDDRKTTWLAPERLLLFLQAAEASDAMAAEATLDGTPLALKHAYTATRVEPRTFVGLYADLSALTPDAPHTLSIKLSGIAPGTFQGAFFDNVEPQLTTEIEAAKP